MREYTTSSNSARTTSQKLGEDRRNELLSVREQMRANPRVSLITIAVNDDACPAGQASQGTYRKDITPEIPIEACSRSQGCNCRYIPVLKEIFP